MAWHLLNERDNEHVSVHELRGFVADNFVDALNESYALSRGTRCTQFLFSLSLSPPERESVPVEVFEKAITDIETKVGLVGQPRAIVFHEKEGRRHAHCVWSRIDPERMRAINLPHFKVKLRDVSRRLYIEHGWRMPAGLIDSAERDPLNFSRAEWQQARRTEQDARALKALFQECWAASDSAAGFQHALDARGLMLARGDRRGVVAVDYRGEVYAVARWVGIPTKAVRARFGDGETLNPVADVRAQMAARLGEKLTGLADEATREFEDAAARLEVKRRIMVVSQRGERRDLADAQARRSVEEARAKSQRLRKGLLGIWDRVVGRHAKLRRQNEIEVDTSARRDAIERQTLIDRQLANRRELQDEFRHIRSAHLDEQALLKRDITDTQAMAQTEMPTETEPRRKEPRKRRRRSGPSL
ncbi:relaxase/mobilization nuclease domain-containing protein [Methylobacterium marchantiae]|uniref:Relaxase/mobilization nuclease domain-containing protein n=1 Tax=Methylobacterium marchantiae TaxID=600331 RepID=A0ABW3X202_9HYPH